MHNPSNIKYISRLPIGTLHKSKVIRSILEHTTESMKYKFVFNIGGTIVERTYDKSFPVGGCNPRTQGSCNKFMAIHLRDGSWKCGIVGFREVEQTIGRELVSIYVRKLKSPYTRDWEWPGTLYKGAAPDDILGEKMKFYCEDMEKAVEAKDMSKLNRQFGTMEDYLRLYYFVNGRPNGYVRWLEVLPMGRTPEDIDEPSRIKVQKYRYSVPPEGYEKWKDAPPVSFALAKTQYVKSFYKDVKVKVLKKEVFYLEDLLAIYDENTPREVGDEDSAMVWNSLDATCHGNV